MDNYEVGRFFGTQRRYLNECNWDIMLK